MGKVLILGVLALVSTTANAKEIIKKVTGDSLALICTEELEKRVGDKIEFYSSSESGDPVRTGTRDALKVGDRVEFYKVGIGRKRLAEKKIVATAEVTSVKDDCVTAKGDLESVYPGIDVKKTR